MATLNATLPHFGKGVMAAVGIPSALLERRRRGRGERIVFEALDVEIFALEPRAQDQVPEEIGEGGNERCL